MPESPLHWNAKPKRDGRPQGAREMPRACRKGGKAPDDDEDDVAGPSYCCIQAQLSILRDAFGPLAVGNLPWIWTTSLA